MKILKQIAWEFKTFTKLEKIFFPLAILTAIFISIIKHDNIIALVSAFCGISYTILAGKGKIFCFFIGLLGSFCYVYLALQNGFLGNALLYGAYYVPMQIIGIFNWKKNLKKETFEIIKTSLPMFNKVKYFLLALLFGLISSFVLYKLGGKSPLLDSFAVVFSIFGQVLTVKRCIEQWFFWFIVNFISLFMWITAVLNGAKTYATCLMWLVYLILSVYFYIIWKKEISKNSQNI